MAASPPLGLAGAEKPGDMNGSLKPDPQKVLPCAWVTIHATQICLDLSHDPSINNPLIQ